MNTEQQPFRGSSSVPAPDPAFHFDADPDPDSAFHFDADPDSAFHFDADRSGSSFSTFDADPDPAMMPIYADPDPQHWESGPE